MLRKLLGGYALAHVDELRWQISRTPVAAVGGAFAAGLAAGSSQHASKFVRREAVHAALAMLGTLLFSAAKKAAVHGAREWFEQRR